MRPEAGRASSDGWEGGQPGCGTWRVGVGGGHPPEEVLSRSSSCEDGVPRRRTSG